MKDQKKKSATTEKRYRKKGDNNAEEKEAAQEEKKDDDKKGNKYRKKGEKTEGAEEGEKEKPAQEKNLVYKNPMEFKETRTFKTKAEEFRSGDWRKPQGKTYVTLETVIPALPKTIFTKPDQEAFRKKISELDEKIQEINKSLEEKKEHFDETLGKK